ncbi:efflux RND transporter permease subunit [Parashewanella curva]|uniref:Efflux RND transporter permease subunit n=1 Tax=Parashewanella curva TaxID=2338552 RepID=A0A3L8PV98_9GAMM|nr:efflux RND transporter permease subunit [Parashewanella curva]RLV58689.1 efflux RND transporter permease subunit [Parashewanella curva]
MQLPEVCIRHPIFASILSIMAVLFGIIAFQKLEIQYFPEHTKHTASVSASVPGASADFMSSNVADKLIAAVGGLDKVETMTTNCNIGSCSLNIKFTDDTNDIEYTNLMNKLRSSIEAIDDFPSAMVNKPTVTDDISAGGSSSSNIITFVNTGGMTQQQMYDYIVQQLVPQFKHINGVGAVWGPYGGSHRAVRVWLNPDQMKELKVSTADVVTVLDAYNSSFTAGSIVGKARNFSLNPVTQVQSVDDVKQLVIRQDDNNRIIRMSDVADVEMGERSLNPSQLSIDEKPGLAIQVRPLRNANPVQVSALIVKEIERMQKRLPQSIQMQLVYNQADFINASIHEGFSALMEAIVLVSIVVLIFLGSLRAASVPIITIPVCVIGVFAVMSYLGFSINVLTILAIILAIGLVVDDAIVVVENCYRHIEQGDAPFDAALKGCKEIIFPVISMTLTLAAVYLPIGLMSGLTVDLFKQFSFTLAAAVIISGMVALTLSPMMSAYLLKPASDYAVWFRRVNRFLHELNDTYTRLLKRSLTKKGHLFGIGAILVVLASIAYWQLPKILLPQEDSGFIQLVSKAPVGVGRSYHLEHINQINDLSKGEPAVRTNLSFIESQLTNFILLKPWDERKQDINDVISDLMEKAKKTVSAYGVSFSIYNADNLNISKNVVLEITALRRGKEALSQSAKKVTQLLKNYPGLANVNNSLVRDQLRYDLSIDPNAITLSGVSYSDVTNALSVFLGSVKAADLHAKDDQTYSILVQVNQKDLGDFNVLNKLYVTSASGQSLPLSQFVTIKEATAESSIKTFGGMDSAQITADIAPGYSTSQIKDYIDENVPKQLTSSQDFVYNGVIKELMDSQRGTASLFFLALVFIYLILAAQFESFVDPLIILLTVPLCLVGALLTLYIFGQSLNIYSQIGLLTLVGLVTKHGILLVEFANKQQDKGVKALDAAILSAQSRLRPILMTSLTMILSAIPLALATGPGSLGLANIGLVLVGGLIAGTLFSLFVVPVAYVAMAQLRAEDALASLRNHSRK